LIDYLDEMEASFEEQEKCTVWVLLQFGVKDFFAELQVALSLAKKK